MLKTALSRIERHKKWVFCRDILVYEVSSDKELFWKTWVTRKRLLYNFFVATLYRVFRYSSDKFRGLIVDIKTNKNRNGTWNLKPRLVGENREHTYSARGPEERENGCYLMQQCMWFTHDSVPANCSCEMRNYHDVTHPRRWTRCLASMSARSQSL